MTNNVTSVPENHYLSPTARIACWGGRGWWKCYRAETARPRLRNIVATYHHRPLTPATYASAAQTLTPVQVDLTNQAETERFFAPSDPIRLPRGG